MSTIVSSDSVASDQLRSFVERIERLEEEIKDKNGDKSEVYSEAKGNGFDVKVLRKIIADRRKDYADRMEFETIYELYAAALGMQAFRVDADDEDETGTVVATGARTKPAEPAQEALNDRPAVLSPRIEDSLHPNQRAGADDPGSDVELVAPIPTPAGGGNTTEPDSGLGACMVAEVAAEPERLEFSPPDPLRSEAATRKDAETTAPAKRHELTEAAGNPNCQKLKRGEDCMFSHQGFSCAECNFIWATERQKARKRVAA